MSQVKALSLLKEGIAAARAGDKPLTRRLLREVTELQPRNEVAWLWLAGVAESPPDALECLERVLEINPANERAQAGIKNAYLQAGAAAAKAGDRARARTLLTRAAEGDPRNENAWMWLAGVTDSSEEAIEYLEKVLALNPSNERARQGIAWHRARLTPPARSDGSALAARKAAAEAAARARGEGEPAAKPAAATCTVLIVDDSPTIRKLVAMTLERVGHRVVAAGDGREAIDRLREHGIPDLILLDITMPGMDGYELCGLLRQNRDTARVPIVMLSGKDGFFSKLRGQMAGSTDYITKPFQPEKLVGAVARYCRAAAPV